MFLLATEVQQFCGDAAPLMKFLHTVLNIFKIVVPVLLIIFGMVDLGKAVVSSDEKAIKGSTSSLIRKLIAALVIFFLPSIISAVVNLADNKGKYGSSECVKCVTSGGDYCKDASGKVID